MSFPEEHIEWFSAIIDTSIQLYFQQECPVGSISEIAPPNAPWLDKFLPEISLTFDEQIVLMLALMPHLRPQVLDTFFIQNKNLDRPFTEFGGWKGNTHGGFLPTGETAAFIIAGTNQEKRFQLINLFSEDHFFARQNILKIVRTERDEPFLSGLLSISSEFIFLLTTGQQQRPAYSIDFPAKRVETRLDWDDLVLPPHTIDELEDIHAWIGNSAQIMNHPHLSRFIKPGYRALFYGPPGTGKTLTVSLLGKRNNMDVYRIDLSMLVSKYIGETEKNLANVFDQAQNKNWILFFDEADALFGKRTQTRSSNDRHANQEVAYLLQRIEDYPGTVILASNLKSNIDDAFLRRFQCAIFFPIPDTAQRLELWKNMLPNEWLQRSSTDLKQLAANYELSGGSISNVIRYCALRLIRTNTNTLSHEILTDGIKKELRKEGKTL